METPFMEVIRFDAENIIATSDGPGVNTHSWDSVTKLLTCPQGHEDQSHYIITEIKGAGDVICLRYTNGQAPLGPSWMSSSYFEDAAVDNWYVYGGEQSQYRYIKCNDGK